MDMCRVCLKKSPEKDINSLKTTKKQEPKSSREIFEFCLNIQLTEDSKITTKLCSKCYQKIVSFYKFKLLALKSDEYFRAIADVKKDLVKLELLKESDVSNSSFNIGDSVIDPAEIVNGIKDEPLIKVEIETDSEDDILSNIKLKTVKEVLIQYSPPRENNLENIIIESIQPKEVKSKVPPRVRGELRRNRQGKRGRVQKIHTKKKVCSECGKSVSDLKEHMLQHVPVEQRRKFPCKDCNKTFLTYGARYRHYRNKHLGIYQKCEICGKKVVSLWSHIARVHNQDLLKHECSICKGRFICKSELDQHTLLHTKEKPFQCDICLKQFRSKLILVNHKRRIHEGEKANLCEYCPKRFFQKCHLQVHMRMHTKERPYKCDMCESAFSDSKGLRNHVNRIHVAKRSFSCELCLRTFVCKDYLRAHMVSHTKEKKFECKYCGIKFGRSDHRKRHQYTAHEKHILPSGENDNVPKSYKRYYSKKDKGFDDN